MFRRISVLGIVMMFMFGCAPFKELRPKPDLSDSEQGYVELKHGDKSFDLKKNNKYYVEFPAPRNEHFYVVLSIPQKKAVESYFSGSYVDKKHPGEKINDETPYPDSVSVYPIEKQATGYFWFIDKVPQDLTLGIKYRYVPQWRYKFETNHTRLKATLEKNLVDRNPYKNVGPSFRFEGFNYALAIDTVVKHTAALNGVLKELLDIEKIFPSSIVNSNDPAYKNYVQLKGDLDDEIAFQSKYHSVLEFFYKEYQCRNSTLELLGRVPDFINFFLMKDKLADNVLKESQTLLGKRLNEVRPFYEKRLGEKTDAGLLEPDYYRLSSFNKIPELYQTAGMPMPQDFATLFNFVNAYDAKTKGVNTAKDSMNTLMNFIKSQPPMPDDNFFKGIMSRATNIQSLVPKQIDQQYGTYSNFPCTQALNQSLGNLSNDVAKRVEEFRQAEAVVPQLNILKAQQDYTGMLAMLRQYMPLGFLVDKYRDLDKLSVEKQKSGIQTALDNMGWAQAESGLQKLHADENFIDQTSMLPVKELVVRDLEDSLYTRIERVSRSRVNKFVEDSVGRLENVDSMYTDSVFLPAHTVTFSSGSKQDLVTRQNALISDLAKMKENEFPAKAIKLLYEQFIKSPGDNGVLKARAIVTHGEHYKGTDKEIKLRVSECDPHTAKWISKPKDYRRVFALPVSSNKRGKNKYMVRLNVNIPTEANFPVYDVNVKLPKEIAQNAATTQWYDEIKLNKKLLKNEGRFVISAPTSTNDYECQITPVQMNKDENNILEVSFTADGFKPFVISVMVQKPIIKKN